MRSFKHTIKSLLRIQKVNSLNAEITSPVCLKIINNDKGRSIFLNSMKSIETLAILEFIPGAEIRGNHYHLYKTETLYIIDGNTLWQSDRSGNKQSRLLIAEGGCLMKTSVLTCILGKL